MKSKNVKFLVLNEKGIQLYQQLTAAMKERANTLESVLDNEERTLFYQMLEKIEIKAEKMLAEQAITKIANAEEPPGDQKELIRWYNKSNRKLE